MGLMSRPGLVVLEVATRERCRDLAWAGCLGVSRPVHAQPARDLRWLCARHARDQPAVRTAAPTTWALRAQCARDLGSRCAHCAPNPVL